MRLEIIVPWRQTLLAKAVDNIGLEDAAALLLRPNGFHCGRGNVLGLIRDNWMSRPSMLKTGVPPPIQNASERESRPKQLIARNVSN
jgi:hypothetical protein